jgi:hypothetical protein
MTTSAIALLAWFIVKHLFCDFHPKIQTPLMVMHKGTYGHPSGIAHSFVHVVASAIVLLLLLPTWELAIYDQTSIHLGILAGLLLFEGLVHYHMDWFKMWWNRRNEYTPADGEFWWWLGVDQTVHYFTYVIMVIVWT